MINIFTVKGEQYSYDPDTNRVFKDGYLLPSTQTEPVYSKTDSEHAPPRFSGLLLKAIGSLLSLSGKISPISDPNTIY